VAKLNAEVQKVFSDPEFQKRFMEPQMFEAMPGSPQDFATFIKGEQAKWAKVIRDGHITLE
jgi:tripartite-type tricarboxylate transporter receptor subunit TctC